MQIIGVGMNQVNVEEHLEQKIEEVIGQAWHMVIDISSKVLHQAKVHGFQFMDIQNPSVDDFISLLDVVILPVIEKLRSSGNVTPMAEMKLININQYHLRLRQISVALKQMDEIAFAGAVSDLRREIM